jgi:hypothetical protein
MRPTVVRRSALRLDALRGERRTDSGAGLIGELERATAQLRER